MFLAPKRVLQLSAIPIPNSRMETRPSLLMNWTFQLRQAFKLELKEDVSLILPKKRTLEHPLNLLWSVKLRYKSCYILFYFQISYLKSPNVCTWPVGQHYFSSLTQVPQMLQLSQIEYAFHFLIFFTTWSNFCVKIADSITPANV